MTLREMCDVAETLCVGEYGLDRTTEFLAGLEPSEETYDDLLASWGVGGAAQVGQDEMMRLLGEGG